MTNEVSDFTTGKDTQTGYSKLNETYSPVIVTDTVGALLLGIMSIILMALVGGLLVRNRKLEDQLRKFGNYMDY